MCIRDSAESIVSDWVGDCQLGLTAIFIRPSSRAQRLDNYGTISLCQRADGYHFYDSIRWAGLRSLANLPRAALNFQAEATAEQLLVAR